MDTNRTETNAENARRQILTYLLSIGYKIMQNDGKDAMLGKEFASGFGTFVSLSEDSLSAKTILALPGGGGQIGEASAPWSEALGKKTLGCLNRLIAGSRREMMTKAKKGL